MGPPLQLVLISAPGQGWPWGQRGGSSSRGFSTDLKPGWGQGAGAAGPAAHNYVSAGCIQVETISFSCHLWESGEAPGEQEGLLAHGGVGWEDSMVFPWGRGDGLAGPGVAP